MSEDHEDYNHVLSDDELVLIQDQYRRDRLRQDLIGPCISTLTHIVIVVMAALFFQGEVVKKNETVEITPVQEEVPKEEPPPPPPPPEIPPPEPQEVVSHDPQVSSEAVADAADLVGAIDDVSDEPPSTDDSAEADLVSDVKPSASSIVSSKMFGGRSAAGRAGSLKTYGGSAAGQSSLGKALNWLAKVQNPDGTWGEGRQEACTALAVLTFLAHGETPKSKNFGTHVSKGIAKLAEWGNSGDFPLHGGGRGVYSHGLVAYALSEAYGMTGNYNLQEPMEKTIKFIVDNQQSNGGYFYGYKKGEDGKEVSNLSNASYNYQALKAAKAAGCDVEGLQEAIDKAVAHMLKFNNGTEFYYRTDAMDKNRRGPSMRAVGVLCLQLMGEHDNPVTLKIGKYMADNDLKYLNWNARTGSGEPTGFMTYWMYYATQVMFQRGGSDWKAWNSKYQKLLTQNQNPEGWWLSPGKAEWDRSGMLDIDNKVYATTMCALQLTVYYRYLPSSVVSRDKSLQSKHSLKGMKNANEKPGEENVDIF